MNCNQVDNLLQDFLDGDLEKVQLEAIAEHHKTCEACNKAYSEMAQVKSLLKNISIPPHSEGFVERALNKATQQPETMRNPALVALGGSIAAGLAAWLFMSSMIPIDATSPGSGTYDGYMVTVNKEVKTIKLAINSKEALSGITMTVELSSNLELSGYRGQQVIKWNTNLTQGSNILFLPIIGLASGSGKIITRIQMKGKQKVMIIKTHFDKNSPENVKRPAYTDTYS